MYFLGKGWRSREWGGSKREITSGLRGGRLMLLKFISLR